VTDERPEFLDRCTPRPAPVALRLQTLSAVERELARQRTPRWERGFELAVAASLLLGVGLNVWLWRTDESRQMEFAQRAPSAAAREVARAVALAAGPAAGQWVQDEFSRAQSRKRGRGAAGNEWYQRLLHDLTEGRIPESL
jgi:hypothetical protein